MDIDFPPAGAEWTFFVCALVILIGPVLAQRMRLPGMVGVVLGGLVIGPNVLDWVPREGIVEGVGQLGLLTLMFLAGLELDLEEFARRRTESVRFGLITFTLPLVLGIAAGVSGFDYGWAAAILYGSLWASHTLVAYPIVRSAGLAGHRAVGMSVSGTVITDTLALFVLAVVVGSQTGDGSTAAIVGGLMLGLAVLVVVAFVLLPRIVKVFFATLGRDRSVRFIGVIAVFTGIAVVADLGGMEGIVGAFFAGLAINRLIPNRSPLMERLEFFGSSLLVPFFLISTGMLIDPAKFTEAETLALGGVSLAVVVVGKLGAAAIAGRLGGFTRDEIGIVFSLTVAQAAATLAAVIVGLEAGIFDETLVNAALVVVLVSLVIAPLGAAYYTPRVRVPSGEEGSRRLGEAVLVPLADEHVEDRARLGALLARSDKGVVLAVALAPEPAGPETRAEARARLGRAEEVIGGLGVEYESGVRVADSVAGGALRAAVEHDASCMVVSWAGVVAARQAVFGGSLTGLRVAAHVPALVVAAGGAPPERVVLALAHDDLAPRGHPETLLAVRTARLLAHGLGTEPRILAPDPDVARPLLVGLENAPVHGFPGTRAEALAVDLGPGDLVVLPGRMTPGVLDGDAAPLARAGGPTVVLAVPPRSAGGDDLASLILKARA
ncbi:MAG: cation:proton antiporter [Thermoleophilia bacterium]